MVRYFIILSVSFILFIPFTSQGQEHEYLVSNMQGKAEINGTYKFNYGGPDQVITGYMITITRNKKGDISLLKNFENQPSYNLTYDYPSLPDNYLSRGYQPPSLVSSYKNISLQTSNFNFYGLFYGALSIPKMIGRAFPNYDPRGSEISFPQSMVIRDVQHQISQDVTLSLHTTFTKPPDFIQVLVIGNNVKKLETSWGLQDGQKNLGYLPILSQPDLEGFYVLEKQGSLPILDPIFSNSAPLEDKIKIFSNNLSLDAEKQDIQNHSYFSGFKKSGLDVTLMAHQETVQHESEWRFYYETLGVLIKPIFIDEIIADDPTQQENYFQTFKQSQNVQEIILSYGSLLSLLKQGHTEKIFSFALREILMDRLKSTSDLPLKEIFAQLLRLLNRFQREYLIPDIHTELKEIENRESETENQLTQLSKLQERITQGSLSGKAEVFEQIKSKVKEFIETESLDIEKITQVKDALSCFLDSNERVCKDQMATTLTELKALFPQDSEIGILLNKINQDVLASHPEALYTVLSKIIKTLDDIQTESADKLGKIKALCQEIEALPTENISWKEINDKINQIKIASKTISIELTEKQRDLKIKLDLIQTDSIIFENEEPWEQLN